ncbi:MAG TPA: aldo/keto reductase [Vicinamibacteria bacterium]|nr:aldo/keto reductase [Vicinamibacteria bacterium]
MAGLERSRRENRLAASTSPYLLQHARNPVDWYPWGEEALSRARREGKPILLSIGYSSCHWCHVMERESFENEGIAALMNESFVCIKVDREERPDLDDIYMAATVAMNQGQGGWPMTVFLTPEQEPFFAGTYFPPEDRWGRPGFPTLLRRIAELWRNDEASLRQQGAQLVGFLREGTRAAPGLTIGGDEIRTALAQYRRDFDARWGGFGAAPKFPPAVGLMLLLRGHRRFEDAEALAMVTKTLDAMAAGGMYDQVGGGFHRYSVDEQWLVPHFEKMLYDNALLARAYLEGFQATASPQYQRIATETLDYVLREMTAPEGGFYSATDADSEGEEGRFFVWTPDEVRAAVGDDEEARRFAEYHDVTEAGNWEGKSVLHVARPLADVAARLAVRPEDLEASLAVARAKVYRARLLREKPALDDKVITSWNGLMIGAFAEAARVLGDPRYLEAGTRAADFLLAQHRKPDGRLLRTSRAGRAHLDAYLEDYAYLADALLDLHEAGAPARYLRAAEELARLMLEDFRAEEGGFYSTARGHEALVVRPREGHDGATPSANAVAASALARLSYHLDEDALRGHAAAALRAYGRAIARQPRAFARSLIVADLLLDGPVELAFVGRPGSADLEALRRETGRHFLPSRIVSHRDPDGEDPGLPLLAGKDLVDGRAALYVCRDFACQRPVTDPSAVEGALRAGATQRSVRPAALEARLRAGFATPDGTARYAARQGMPPTGYRPLGRTGLRVSAIGFGGYRVDEDHVEHRDALREALASGINLVDTSTNYTDGGSERVVGAVLAELVERGTIARDEVVIVTKAGYVQGETLARAAEREEAGRPWPDMVKYADGVWHCIHPDFLRDQLAASRERLQLQAIDVVLLHNPEYFLMDAHERSHGTLERRREEFDARLRGAFAFLEEEVRAGRVGSYGVSSNTLAAPADRAEATSLERMLAMATEAGGAGHHFHVVQLPFNLLEAEGLGADSGTEGVIQRASAAGIGVLVNRPLNAASGDGLLRLADVDAEEPAIDLEEHLARLATLEAEYRERIAAHLEAEPGGVPPEHFFRWSADLQGALHHVQGIDHWDAVESQRILPRLLRAMQVLDQALTGPLAQDWHDWRARYGSTLQPALDEIRRRAAERTGRDARAVAEALDAALPARKGEPLARRALWLAASVPGVSCVLNGMRTPAYVRDALAVLRWPPAADVRPAVEAARGALAAERA